MTNLRLPPIGFWSYARRDDDLSQGKLSTLRSLLMAELQQQYGRDQIHIFQDASTIPHGAAWEREIREALGRTTFFIPIVTPNFIQSDWCCQEVSIFLEREAELCDIYPDLPRRSRIFPIQFIDIDDVDPADPAALTALQSLQWFDFRRFRHRSYENETVREAISELAGGMRDLLQIKVQDPVEARDRARQAEEAATRARREEEAGPAPAKAAARKGAAKADEAPRLEPEEAAETARILADDEAADCARLEKEAAAGPDEHEEQDDMSVRFKVPAPLLALAGSVLALLLVYLLWNPTQPSKAEPAASSAEPAAASPAGPSAADSVGSQAWLYGQWSPYEDCSAIMTISDRGDQIWIDFEINHHGEMILSAAPESVETDRNIYRRSGEAIEVSEKAADGRTIPYRLTRCAQ